MLIKSFQIPVFFLSLILFTLILTTACSTPTEKRRSTGASIDDTSIEIGAQNYIDNSDFMDSNDRIISVSHNGRLLLAGEVSSAEKKARAEKTAYQIKGVKHVYNELSVGPKASASTRMNDTYLTTKINTSLLNQNPIEGLDSARINVTTSQSTAYLMGLVTRNEGVAVAEVASNIHGVKKVVKLFEYVE
ncbi:MAG: BON domain-containing protein [Proteobacteria bacterium]|nr:BON domain-containing protein [Pseudomonadota bacterium]